MNFEKIKNSILEKISKNELEEAIQILKHLLSNNRILDELIVISANLNNLKGDMRKNCITYEQSETSRNRIISSIVELIHEIEDFVENDKNSFPEKDENILKGKNIG